MDILKNRLAEAEGRAAEALEKMKQVALSPCISFLMGCHACHQCGMCMHFYWIINFGLS